MRYITSLSLILVTAIGCGKKNSESSSAEETGELNDTGGVTQTLDAASTESQTIDVSAGSTLEGTSVEFPPGSLVLSTDVTIEEGTSLATNYVNSVLGLSESEHMESAGPATVVSAENEQDASQPFTIQVLVAESGLNLLSELMILYKVRKVEEDKLVLGLVPSSEISIDGEKAVFESQHFGVFQAIVSPSGVTVEDIETTIPISTKANPPSIAFTKKSASVNEGDGIVEVSVTLSEPREDLVVVSYILSGTSDEDDHGLVGGSFILEPTTISQTLSFNVTDDNAKEDTETLVLSLSTAQNARIGEQSDFTLSIKDND